MADDSNDHINIRLGSGVSRRKLMRQVAGAASVGALGGMTGIVGPTQDNSAVFAQDDGQDGQAPPFQLVELIPPPTELDFTSEGPERTITMVTHDASTSFFVPTIAGLHDAARHVGWSANFTGPSSGFDVQKQVSILESAVDSGPDVIATTITNKSAYNKVIQRALDDDIFVILYNTNALNREEMRNNFGRALAFTGQNQVAAGFACGLAFLDELPDDASLATIGTCCPGHSALEARSQGIEMAIRQRSDVELTNRINYTGKAGEGISKLENHITANPNLDGIVGTDAFTWFIGDAIGNQNADIVGGGFDLTEQTLTHIQDGNLQFTVGQDPYSQGYIPTVQSWEYLERGMPPKDYDTAAEIIDSENIEFASQRSGNWGTLREWQQSQ